MRKMVFEGSKWERQELIRERSNDETKVKNLHKGTNKNEISHDRYGKNVKTDRGSTQVEGGNLTKRRK